MPRNVFEAMDRRASAAVDRLLQEPCEWRPMLVRTTGGNYTIDQNVQPDPNRPPMARLRAVVTWKDTLGDQTGGAGGNQVASGQLVVDLDESQFGGLRPRKGDRFYLPEQSPGERLVEITRTMDDGSVRSLYICKVV